MFRALLWKEWRELWVLPAVAVLLAAIGCYVVALGKLHLWTLAAFVVLPGAAVILVPAHIFTKGTEIDAARFLLSKPIDRFRLWWFRLAVSIILLAGIAIVMGGVMGGLHYFLPKARLFYLSEPKMIWSFCGLYLFLFSLTTLVAVFARSLARAMIGVVLVFLFSAALVAGISISFLLLRAQHLIELWLIMWPAPGSLIVSPILLFASLMLFARKDLWRATRGCIAAGYAVSAVVFFTPPVFQIAHLLPKAQDILMRPPAESLSAFEEIRVHDISDNGQTMIVSLGRDRRHYDIDLKKRHVTEMEKPDFSNQTRDPAAGEEALGSGRTVVTVSDFRGIDEIPLHYKRSPHDRVVPSVDGSYRALTESGPPTSRRSRSIRITNSSGLVLAQHEFPPLDESSLFAVGWDSESRFYYRAESSKRGRVVNTYWRMHVPEAATPTLHIEPQYPAPEKVSFIPAAGEQYSSASPDGDWIVCGVFDTDALDSPINASSFLAAKVLSMKSERKLWLCDTSSESANLISENPGLPPFLWTHDGGRLAYIEIAGGSSQLVIFDLKTGEKSWAPLGRTADVTLHSWSPSDEHLLLRAKTPQSKAGFGASTPERFGQPYVFSTATGNMAKVTLPDKDWDSSWLRDRVTWFKGDRLLWLTSNRAVQTDADGSNPEELFRVEDGDFYLYGEEVG